MSASALFRGRAFSATEYFLRMLRIYIWGSVNPKVNKDFVCLLSNRGPQSKPRLCLFAKNRGLHNKPRLCLFVMGRRESGGTSCPLPSGYPKVNQDFICLLLGERRYMSPNDARHQSLRPCYRTRRHQSMRPYC